ncbi:MAG: hypothetical protein IPK68_09970 [Bdellovibrionales bacterium]|nr:hypothetical protein [Bdellovibrionales bacterium]
MEDSWNSVKGIVEISSGLLTPVIAIAVGWITYRQMKITQAEVRLSLYDRRLQVFENVKKFLSFIARDAALETKTLLELKHETNQAIFLFDKEVSDYIDQLYKKGLDFRGTNLKLNGEGRLPVGQERNKVVQENSDILKWFLNQFDVSRDLFKKYMSFNDF